LPSLRSYYRPALDISLAVIHQQAVTLDSSGGHVDLPSIVLDMGVTFGAYLRNSLTIQAVAANWSLAVLNGNHGGDGGEKKLLDHGVDTKANPDIVIASQVKRPRTYPLVIEVKYKPADKHGRDDLNQVIAYGASYGCPAVMLVQPRGRKSGPQPGLSLLGLVGRMAVYRYVYDLGASSLVEEESRFGAVVAKLATSEGEAEYRESFLGVPA